MNERKTTSIKVNPDLWKEFKKHAIDEDKDLSDILEEMIKRRLRNETQEKWRAKG